MADRKIIAVIGATGAQGGGLVRAIQADRGGGYVARAITRDPASDKAKALAALGAEVVAADVDDPASLRRAFAGAHGAFCVTFFWDHFSPEREQAQARAMAEAAAGEGVAHVVWSTLEDTRLSYAMDDPRVPTLMERYKVPHFDGKGAADHVFTEMGVPTSFLLTSFFWENFLYFGMGPKPDADGNLVLGLPMGDKPLAGIAAGDIGRCAYGLFRRGVKPGERVGIAGGHLTGTEMAASMAAALGRPVTYQAIPIDTYRGFGFPGADDLANMFQYYQDFAGPFCAARSLEASRALNPALADFPTWLAANKAAIPLS